MSKHPNAAQAAAENEAAVAVLESETSLTDVSNDLTFDDIAADAGAGLENVTAADVQTPFLAILQKMSPQVDQADRRYVKGAEPGKIYNTVTGELYDGKVGITGVFVYFAKEVIEWVPREQGGGLAGRHKVGSAEHLAGVRTDKGLFAPNGNQLKETASHGFLFTNPNTGVQQKAVVSMTSTQLKKSKRLISLLDDATEKDPKTGREIKLPTYVQVFHVSAVPEENKKGNFYGWKIERVGKLRDRATYNAAKAYGEFLKKQGVPVSESTDPDEHEQGADSSSGPEVPF